MTIVLKFKDGLTVTSGMSDNMRFDIEGDFIENLKTGYKNDKDITVSNSDGIKVVKKYQEIYSLEVIL